MNRERDSGTSKISILLEISSKPGLIFLIVNYPKGHFGEDVMRPMPVGKCQSDITVMKAFIISVQLFQLDWKKMSIVGKKHDGLGNCFDLNVGSSTLGLINIFTSGRMVII